jgi:hypothetical protein
MPEPSTVTKILKTLADRGYTANLGVIEGALRVLDTGKVLRPEDLVIREVHRFEGESNPDDMSVVYAIESKDGTRGVIVDAFGTYADPQVREALKQVPICDPLGRQDARC